MAEIPEEDAPYDFVDRHGDLLTRARTWSHWQRLMSESSRCEEGRAAGVWALETLASHLGSDWLGRVFDAEGRLPDDIVWSSAHIAAFAEIVQLATYLDVCKDLPGFVPIRSSLRSDLRHESRMHCALQLEVASMMASKNASVSFERKILNPNLPVDVYSVTNGRTMAIETFVVMMDSQMKAGNALSDILDNELLRIMFANDVIFEGTIDPFSKDEIPSIIDAIELAASEVAVSGDSHQVAHRLVHYTVRPMAASRTGTTFELPSGTAKGWKRTVSILRKKAERSTESGASWLRVDVLDGLWQITPWSQYRLADKTLSLANAVQDALAAFDAIRGIVLSSGSLTAFGGGLHGETTYPPTSARGMRRTLSGIRARETMVFNFADDAADESRWWYEMYDEERTWLDDTLASRGFASLDTLASVVP